MGNESVLSGFFIPERASEVFQDYMLRDSVAALNVLSGPRGSTAPIQVGPLPAAQKGQYFTATRFDKMANIVTRRDLTSVAAATLVAMTTGSEKAPVVNMKLGPVWLPKGTLWMAGLTHAQAEANFVKQAADQFRLAMQSHILAALKGSTLAFIAGASGASFEYDHAYSVWNNSAAVNLSVAALSSGRAEMGDRIDLLTPGRAGILMRSEVFNDLTSGQLALTSTGSWAEAVARGGAPATLGLPYALVDNTHLKTAAVASSSTKSKWYTYILGSGAIEVEIVRVEFQPPQISNSLEQPGVYLRGDADITIRVPGMNYKSTANPTETTLATTGSWEIKANDHREFPVIRIETNSAAT